MSNRRRNYTVIGVSFSYTGRHLEWSCDKRYHYGAPRNRPKRRDRVAYCNCERWLAAVKAELGATP